MNQKVKRFQVNQVWTSLEKAHTILWFHRNPMNAAQKQSLLTSVWKVDPKARFFWTTNRVIEQIATQPLFMLSKNSNSQRRIRLTSVSQGPCAILTLSGPVQNFPGLWKCIQAQQTLIIMGAQIQDQWYNSEEVVRMMTLRPIPVYSELLSVLQIPLLLSSLLDHHTTQNLRDLTNTSKNILSTNSEESPSERKR